MRAVLTLSLIASTLFGNAQTLFSETFEGSPAFTLNTTDAGSTVSAWNTWVVNNSYTGGDGDVICLGFPFSYTIVNTPAQPVGITSPNGNYLHTASVEGIADGITCCSFGAADGLCISADNTFSRMSNDVSTVGYSDVEFKFWWVCEGGNSYYGQVYYSTNGGGSWTATSAPAQYNFQGSWTEQTVTLPDFGNQPTLRFGFRFVNAVGFGATDPGFAIDDVRILGGNTNPTSIACSVSINAYCAGAPANVSYTINGTFNGGNVFTAQLSDASGSFASPVSIGSVASVTGGSIACVIPPGTPAGTGYRIRVVGSSPATTGTDNGANITINAPPDAGADNAINICSGADPVSIATGGDANGTWSGPSTVVGDLYDPATMLGGTYTYMVIGLAPCPNDAATVVVTELPGANAGISESVVICKNTGLYDLFQYLGGSPDVTGTWTDPNNNAYSGIFNSINGLEGIYTYTVAPGGGCPQDEAVVTVELSEPGNAGPDLALTACATDLPLDLYSQLTTGNLTGYWFQNGAPFDGNADAAGSFVYIDYAQAPCVNDTAFITLTVPVEAYAGENGTLTICTNDDPADLITYLGGTPQTNGTWTGPGGPTDGIFDPATEPAGLYTYTVAGTPPCDDDEAVLAVIIDPCNSVAEVAANSTRLTWLGAEGDMQLFRSAGTGAVTAEVIDARGRPVMHPAVVVANGLLRINAAALAPGAYTLVLRSAEGTALARFVR